MTRPSKSSLVLDGSQIKYRLEADRTSTGSAVHVDWLRFTCALRNAPQLGDVDALWSEPLSFDNVWEPANRQRAFIAALRRLPDCDFAPGVQASELAREVCEVLGPDYSTASEPAKGHDFYRYRLPILRNDQEVGWVGFLSSGDSPRQAAQARTLHVNLYGNACTFASPGWRDRMADLIDTRQADITRCDLALDFFDGMARGLDGVLADYKTGACDVNGRRLKCNMLGDWANGRERSFYLGNKEGGKQTNIYEKGDQLFGLEANSPWVRVELRYGNKLRVLPSDMLRRPGDFFAGASDWHASKLLEIQTSIAPQKVPCEGRLALETVEAEVSRNIRWMLNTAAPTLAAAFKYLDFDEFAPLLHAKRLPGRLSKFCNDELASGFARAFRRVLPAAGTGHAFVTA